MESASASGRSRLERLFFLLSLIFLAVVYGFLATRAGWFPSSLLDRALTQARQIASPPTFVAPRIYDRQGARTSGSGKAPGSSVLLSSWWKEFDWKLGLRLIDREGATLHAWSIDQPNLLPDSFPRAAAGIHRSVQQQPVAGTHLFPDGDILFNLTYLATVRMDACGEIQWRLPTGGHHAIERADDGTFWVAGTRAETTKKTPDYPDGLPGFDQPVYQERLLNISPQGRVLSSINVLDLLYHNDLQRYVFRRLSIRDGVPQKDLVHLNDVEPLPDSLAGAFPLFEPGDLLVSLRDLHLVFVVDPGSREIRWHASLPFVYQHDPEFLDDGWIGVFDNRWDGTPRGTVLGGSRIVALQPLTDSTRVLFPTERSDPFHTNIVGTWQHLEDGNMLLTESRAGRVVEVDPNGETVWEWIHSPYDETHVPTVTEATAYELTAGQVAAWPCSPRD